MKEGISRLEENRQLAIQWTLAEESRLLGKLEKSKFLFPKNGEPALGQLLPLAF